MLSLSNSAWVVFPHPSGPSRDMKKPLAVIIVPHFKTLI
jgi:hypothetical protein